ncbi:DUF4290 domain-containing protein [Lishizhenia sp.]|uniref:DUF4290 domain-containing protein n=1 Tax=Lishizhenia sp. TaxID=2497594 RepID=UPI00299CFB08|nr:DUF4290 domain-containing protein [Lishizhenia sp.]MDX1444897.1 DUF4290 domain-containing protein [Lishizhenia sp.]
MGYNSLEYNTQRRKMQIPEYGRNVQRMINYAVKIENREERNKAAKAIIEVMGQLNPHLRDVDDYKHKLWTHLFIMSDFKMDCDSPYEKPTPESLAEKPARMKYPKNKIKFGHFGNYVQNMIKEAVELEEGEEKEYLKVTIANLMKRHYLVFHTGNVEDRVIADHLEELSKGKLKIDDLSIFTATNQVLKQYGIQPNKRKKVVKPKKRKK